MKVIVDLYRALKQDVFAARYKPNDLITERQIAEQYHVSKVTAGEALHMLCAEGHLTAYPRSGYMVTTLSATEMQQLKRLRRTVEGLSVEILCAEASDADLRTLYDYIDDAAEAAEEVVNAKNTAFHMALARLTGDPYLISLTETILGTASRVQQYVSPARRGDWQDCHRRLTDALIARDEAAARACLLEDIDQR